MEGLPESSSGGLGVVMLAGYARTLAGRIQHELVNGVARKLNDLPEHHIQDLMLSPLRRVVFDAMFWGLPHVLSRSHAHELASSVRFHLHDPRGCRVDAYWVAFSDGRWRSGRGHREHVELTITVAGEDLLALLSGRANPVREYLRGRLRVNGNPLIAARLLLLTRGQVSPPVAARKSPGAARTSRPRQ